MAPVTRYMVLRRSLVPPGWREEYDDYIAEQLFQLCTPFVSLEEPRDFHFLLTQVAFQVMRRYNHRVRPILVRARINELRNRYFAFCCYIQMTSVRFNEFTDRLTVDGQYWEALQRNKVTTRSF